jgi:hypothetical protein
MDSSRLIRASNANSGVKPATKLISRLEKLHCSFNFQIGGNCCMPHSLANSFDFRIHITLFINIFLPAGLAGAGSAISSPCGSPASTAAKYFPKASVLFKVHQRDTVKYCTSNYGLFFDFQHVQHNR